MAAPFEFSELQATRHPRDAPGQLTRLSRIDLEQEIVDVRARIIELQSDPRRPGGAQRGHQAAR